jgi:Ferredoxin-like domain in Api92-like protein
VPNWVSNELALTGSPEDLEAVLAAFGDPDTEDEDRRLLDFARLAPVPDDVVSHEPLEGCILGKHEGGPMDARCWREQHWGSKSNAHWVSVEGSPAAGTLRFEFSTAWTPARPLLPLIDSLWPGLSIDFTFVEPNMVFAGRDRHSSTGKWWVQANARYDEELCRAVLGDSRLTAYLDEDMSEESDEAGEPGDYLIVHL